MKPADTVLKFLESIGHGSEAKFYLDLFRSEAKQSFAVIVVDPSVLQQTTDAVVMDLRFLNLLGLFPIVVLGLSRDTDAAQQAQRLRIKLDQAQLSNAVVDYRGDAAPVVESINRESLPVVVIEGEDADAWYTRLGELLSILRTRKLIFLQSQAGLILRGALLSVVNLSNEYEALRSNQELSEEHRILMYRSRQLIFDLVIHKLLIAVTSPLNLLHELFTVKGAGTLLRKGVRILSHSGYKEIDRSRLRALLENSFDSAFKTDFFSRPISQVYIEEDYRGVALLQDTHLGGYLSKFAVTTEAQGEGIGHDLWQFVSNGYPTIIWRARPGNPISHWYDQQCDGRVNTAEWTVYFRGLDTSLIPDAVSFALQQPVDF